MTDDSRHDYRAYLFARETAENFLLAYARAAVSADDASFARDRGIEELRKLAAHLGFQLVPTEASAEAA
jgi:hypothetical protein